MRVVIAHDFMETYGGAERVTAQMARAFPDAPVVAILGREASPLPQIPYSLRDRNAATMNPLTSASEVSPILRRR